MQFSNKSTSENVTTSITETAVVIEKVLDHTAGLETASVDIDNIQNWKFGQGFNSNRADFKAKQWDHH